MTNTKVSALLDILTVSNNMIRVQWFFFLLILIVLTHWTRIILITIPLTERSVFKISIQFFGKAFLRILNSDIQLDLFFNLWRINSCVILPLLSIIL